MLNCLLIASIGMLPILVIPLRYIFVAGLWGVVSLSSPFIMAVTKSLLQITLEYGIAAERFLPPMIDDFVERLETVHIPRIYAFLRWIPIVARYVPTVDDYALTL